MILMTTLWDGESVIFISQVWKYRVREFLMIFQAYSGDRGRTGIDIFGSPHLGFISCMTMPLSSIDICQMSKYGVWKIVPDKKIWNVKTINVC